MLILKTGRRWRTVINYSMRLWRSSILMHKHLEGEEPPCRKTPRLLNTVFTSWESWYVDEAQSRQAKREFPWQVGQLCSPSNSSFVHYCQKQNKLMNNILILVFKKNAEFIQNSAFHATKCFLFFPLHLRVYTALILILLSSAHHSPKGDCS